MTTVRAHCPESADYSCGYSGIFLVCSIQVHSLERLLWDWAWSDLCVGGGGVAHDSTHGRVSRDMLYMYIGFCVQCSSFPPIVLPWKNCATGYLSLQKCTFLKTNIVFSVLIIRQSFFPNLYHFVYLWWQNSDLSIFFSFPTYIDHSIGSLPSVFWCMGKVLTIQKYNV
jgi:hypothetical protein